MNLHSATYHTSKEVTNSLDSDSEGIENKNNVTTDTSDNSDVRFDSSNNNDFDLITKGDYNALDDFIDIN